MTAGWSWKWGGLPEKMKDTHEISISTIENNKTLDDSQHGDFSISTERKIEQFLAGIDSVNNPDTKIADTKTTEPINNGIKT